MRSAARIVAAGLPAALALGAPPALAHPMTVAYAAVAVQERQVDLSLSVNLFELDLLLSIDRDRDGTVSPAEIESARPRLAEYLARRVSVSSRGAPVPAELAAVRPGRSADGRATLEADLRFRDARPLADVSVRCEPLSDLGPDHRTLARIARGGDVTEFAFERGAIFQVPQASLGGHFLQFLRLGILHIFTGTDHLLFLLGLLIAGGTLLEVVKIVTAFTAAHSLTLSLAALGLVHLPSRLVESAIAASIVFVALENLLRRGLDRRWLLSFGFGLVHGFGFAAALAEMRLPRANLLSSLLAFNGGVELGQVAVVAAVLPLLALLRRGGAYRTVATSASAFILAMGLFWLSQRAL
ncbi:MAG TPA: HupE/UreJ family protein [Anaeromyxobacteraceae bacterium]|nr:HupE/UreJ family protein [Anaeromyxobacteraceae bacterium]